MWNNPIAKYLHIKFPSHSHDLKINPKKKKKNIEELADVFTTEAPKELLDQEKSMAT